MTWTKLTNLKGPQGDQGVQGPVGPQGDPSMYELRGTGSPLGTVSATAAGVYYTDTAGTCGAWRWVSTGTGKNSWIVVSGDTGARLCPLETSTAHMTGPGTELRRVGPLVEFVIHPSCTLIDASLPQGSVLVSLPVGWRPSHTRYATWGTGNSAPANSTSLLSVGTTVALYGANATGAMRAATISWMTNQSWPTALPGTAA